MRFPSIVLVLLALGCADGFQTPSPVRHTSVVKPKTFSPQSFEVTSLFGSNQDGNLQLSKRSLLKRILDRFDTIEAAGLKDVKVSGVIDRIKSLHNPKTYLLLSLLAGLRWQWCFRSPYYWFGVAFCVKWYRARYVFKIPVWDRQPNWNNIITSKDQEKDLKAFTCKKCGSTLFIAKTREFFFEGDTGIGGLGCFACGAKGKENFVMDRDRIVEDVADLDDYFEYERPLDFVSRAERRALLKEAGGDENKANEILLARSATQPETAPAPPTSEPEKTTNEGTEDTTGTTAEMVGTDADLKSNSESVNNNEDTVVQDNTSSAPVPETPKPKKSKKKSNKPPSPVEEADLDILDMDAL